MVKLLGRSLLTLIVLILTTHCVGAQTLDGFISLEDGQKDVRLSKKVSFSFDRISLYQFAGEISKQSGISIYLDPQDLAGSVPLCVNVRDLPVSELMNDISSLVSFRKVQFKWNQVHIDDEYRYKLDTQDFKKLPDLMMEQARKLFRIQYDVVGQMAMASPQKRSQFKAKFAKAMLSKTTDAAQSYLESSPHNSAWWGSVKYLYESLTDQQRDAMFGGTPVVIPYEAVPREQQERLLNLLPLPTVKTDTGVTIPQIPQEMVFRYEEKMADRQRKLLVPRILMEFISGAKYEDATHTSMLATCVVGFSGRGLKERLQAEWLFPGEKRDCAHDETTLEKYDEKEAADFAYAEPLERSMVAVSKCSGVSFLAALPDAGLRIDLARRMKIPVKKIHDVRNEVELNPEIDVMSKWRGDTLLINYPEWFYGEDALYPPTLLDEARIERAKTGYVSFPTIAKGARNLNSIQMKRIRREFPEFAAPPQFIALARIYVVNKEIYTEAGVPLSQEIIRALGGDASRIQGLDQAAAGRFRVRDIKRKTDQGLEQVVTAFEVKLDEGDWTNYVVFGRPKRMSALDKQNRDKRVDVQLGKQ